MKNISNGEPVIGILGGGQLGKMLAMAGGDLGCRNHVYCNEPGSCAFDVASRYTCRPYNDDEALFNFAASVDVITTEFENIPLSTIDFLQTKCSKPFYPGRKALAVSQDRLLEKNLAKKLRIPTPPFWEINSGSSEEANKIQYPAILKTRRNGYDGKGQVRIFDPDSFQKAFQLLGGVPCIAEGVVNFMFEISVIIVRNKEGQTEIYQPFENEHKDGILQTTKWPCRSNMLIKQSCAPNLYAGKLAEALDVVGLLAVELFVCEDQVVFNEIAARPHNSGHLTRDCAVTSQFHNHIRAITGLPLGSTDILQKGTMHNLIGSCGDTKWLACRGARVYHYNKADREGRKVGHVVFMNK